MIEPDLFASDGPDARAPLAVRMRPATLAEVVGQAQAVGPAAPLGRMLRGSESSFRSSLVLWGPPGSGKTTLAMLIASVTGDAFAELSAITAGVKDVRTVISQARNNWDLHGKRTVLFIDEVHRFSKAQQDALLPAVENGWVTLVAATTENPSFAVIAPLLSRSLVVPLQQLRDEDVQLVLQRAVLDDRGLAGTVELDEPALDFLVRLAGGDVRRGLTVLEAAAASLPAGGTVTVECVQAAVATAAPRYDRSGDQHYDVISAFIKSVRGSDVDAALHYLARMLVAGEDPRFIARRLVILASEDIGMADPTALTTAVNAMQAVAFIGMPEARITLAQAVIHLALAPKSNRAYAAINAAIADVEAGRGGEVPAHLRDSSTKSARDLGAGQGYLYPHDDPAGISAATYAPADLVTARYYQPTERGFEQRIGEVSKKIRKSLGRDSGTEVQS